MKTLLTIFLLFVNGLIFAQNPTASTITVQNAEDGKIAVAEFGKASFPTFLLNKKPISPIRFVVAYPGEKGIIEKTIEGNRLDEDIKALLVKLPIGQAISFYNIEVYSSLENGFTELLKFPDRVELKIKD